MTWNGSTPVYNKRYYFKDHLGSIRFVTDTAWAAVFARDYYPFGETQWQGLSETGRYQFTEKERDAETGFDYFGARYYDAEIGRWLSVDPMADKYPGWSPYQYTLNNPLRFVDPKGMEIWIIIEQDNQKIELQYVNGLLYQKDGNEYTGNDAFALGVRDNLNALQGMNNKTITNVIRELINSKMRSTISKSYDGEDGTKGGQDAVNDGKSTDSHTRLTGKTRRYETDIPQTPLQTLLHELRHASDIVGGRLKGLGNAKSSATHPGEIRAVQLENLYRREMVPSHIRTTYKNIKINFPGGNPYAE